MKFYDAHIYYDDLRTDFNQLENLNKKYQCEFIISPQCTIQSELISVHGLLSSFGPDGQHRGAERN